MQHDIGNVLILFSIYAWITFSCLKSPLTQQFIFHRNMGPYSENFIFFETYKGPQKLECLSLSSISSQV